MTWEIVPEPRRVPGWRSGRASSPWWVLVVVGVLVVAAGVGLLLWPFVAASWILVLLFGSALIANGLAVLVRGRGSGASTVAGIVLVAAGTLSILFSEFTAEALVTIVGVALIAVGAFGLMLAARLGERGIPIAMIPAILAIAAGVFALVWPAVALSIVAVLAGLVTLALGVSMIWGALAIRRLTSGGGRA